MKKSLGVVAAFLAIIGISSATTQNSQTKVQTSASVPTISTPASTNTEQQTITPIITPQSTQTTTPSPSLSNNNSYTNSAGDEVHSPAYSSDDSIPAGASAKCKDGTYSFSQSRSGTCSHHGGVSRWL